MPPVRVNIILESFAMGLWIVGVRPADLRGDLVEFYPTRNA